MTIENPYKSPAAANQLPTQVTIQEAPQTLGAAALDGAKVAFKWSSIVFGALALLYLIFIVGMILYRGVVDDDWTAILDPKRRGETASVLALTPLIFIIPCLWASLFGAIIYAARKLAQRSK